MTEGNPKLFISYSWTTPLHEQWVLNLATELRESGVDVILDKWDLKEGHDAHAFMEKMVSDPEIIKVAIICDKLYAEKANGRSGGVGTETQIISPEVYNKEKQSKFVAIVTEKDESAKPYLPIYYRSRIYIDLSDPDLYATNFEQILRWVYDKPLYLKPDIGKKPAFLTDSPSVSLGTTSKFRRAIEAVRSNRDYSKGALNEYFETFTQNLEQFRLTDGDGEFDDKVIENIEQFLPYRNEAIEICLSLAQYRDIPESHQQMHRFFERLIPYMDRPEHVSNYREWDYDNFRFIVHELFLYAIASYLKYECFDAVSYLLRHSYYIEKGFDSDKMIPFSRIRKNMQSLEYRNKRLNLTRASLRADLLEQRSKVSGLSFRQLMQADFVLYIRDSLDSLRNDRRQSWWPETLLYIEGREVAFEIFLRAQSKEYFTKIKRVFDIEEKKDLDVLMQAFLEQKLRIPSWPFSSFNPTILIGYNELATKP